MAEEEVVVTFQANSGLNRTVNLPPPLVGRFLRECLGRVDPPSPFRPAQSMEKCQTLCRRAVMNVSR